MVRRYSAAITTLTALMMTVLVSGCRRHNRGYSHTNYQPYPHHSSHAGLIILLVLVVLVLVVLLVAAGRRR